MKWLEVQHTSLFYCGNGYIDSMGRSIWRRTVSAWRYLMR